MAKGKRVKVNSPKKDSRFFRRTAISSKKLNTNPPTFRGGIRLWGDFNVWFFYYYFTNVCILNVCI